MKLSVVQGSSSSKQGLTALIKERVLYCIHHHRSLDVAASMQQELGLLTHLVTGTPSADAQAWQSQMLLLFQLLLPATGKQAAAGTPPCDPRLPKFNHHILLFFWPLFSAVIVSSFCAPLCSLPTWRSNLFQWIFTGRLGQDSRVEKSVVFKTGSVTVHDMLEHVIAFGCDALVSCQGMCAVCALADMNQCSMYS